MYSRLCVMFVLSLALAALAAPVDESMPEEPRTRVVQIMDSGAQQAQDGSYSFHFRGEDGSFREETAVLMNPGTEDAYLQVTGSYSFFDVNGKEVVVHYKADDRGFVPEGNNISQQISLAAKHNSQLPKLSKTKTTE